MKNEIKILLAVVSLLTAFVIFGILYKTAGETVETYATVSAYALATIFVATMFTMFYYGFNLNNRS